MESDCDKCKNKDNKFLIYCDGCQITLCKTCGKLSASEIKVLQAKDKKVSYFCDSCQNFNTLLQSQINDKNDLIESKNEIITLLKEEIENMKLNHEETSCQNPTFAEILKSQKMDSNKLELLKKTNLPCIIIKPNTHKDSVTTKKTLESKVNPATVSVGINMMKQGKNGSILIKCDSRESTDIMKNQVLKQLGPDYIVEETKLRKPSVRISNIKNMNADQLLNAIKNQNHFLQNEDNISIKVLKTTKNNSNISFAIVECNGSAFRKLLAAKKVNIGFERCPVYENYHVTRCFKCNGFNHTQNECKKREFSCAICSDNHETKTCSNSLKKCTNCVYSNSKFKTNFDFNHEAFNTSCPIYIKQINFIKSRIDFK